RFDLLATDSADLTQLAALRRLAPHAEVFVGAQLAGPLAARPLDDLVEALADASDRSPEALADAAVDRNHARAKLIWRRSQKLLALPDTHGDPAMRAAARQLLIGGHDAVALRSVGVPGVVAALDVLARQALTVLDSGSMSKLGQELQRCLASARAQRGDIALLTDRMTTIDESHGSLRACSDALARAVKATLIERREQREPTAEQAPLVGIGLETHGSGASTAWSSLLDALGEGPRPRSEVERRTIEDMQVFAARSVGASRSATLRSAARPFCWIEYVADTNQPDFEACADLQGFLAAQLQACAGARHLGLIVRGSTTPARPASLALPGSTGEFLPITALVQCLREALAAHGRGPLAMLVLDDPNLLSLELAYELREVVHTLVTRVEGATQPLERVDDLDVRRCEALAAAQLPTHTTGLLAPIASAWRREVAKQLAAQLLARVDGRAQAINLQYIEGLCRRVDRVCQIMLDELGDGAVLAALEAGFAQDRLIMLLNLAQNGLYRFAEPHGWSSIAASLNEAMGAVYNWIRTPGKPVEQGGAPFWIGEATPGEDERVLASRLRIDVRPKRPKDYRDLAVHQDVRLHALLVAWRLVAERGPAAPQLWSLIALGLAHAPNSSRSAQLERLAGDPSAAHFFTSFGPPPLMRLDIEADASDGYELRLASSESAALVFRQRSAVDLEAVDRSLEGLSYLLSRGGASFEGWHYLESLGASLAEDLINHLHEQVERERRVLLDTGRGRDVHLALALPRELMGYPWELMLLPPLAPGRPRELLAERFAVGRQMWSDRGLRRVRRDDPIRVLIVGDPQTGGVNGLVGAREEAEQVAAICEQMQRELDREMDFDRARDVFIGTTFTRAALRQLLREGGYDVLHFAGHGSFDSARPERSGWLLSDGLFTVTELRNTLAWIESPPWLIFANACNAGMIDARASVYQGDVHGMAEACIREGVNAFIAPLWQIHDESARLLAAEFYRCLLLRRSTVGVALHHARVHVRKSWEATRGRTDLGDISWTGMVLFGNPTERLNETSTG
ncbi:MAG TPA: CHAT domain-containing protein, partial [Enhygromyxa sp.]|nr:CHAT domain-containing protein [Enhygromyxa sp.]